MDESTEFNSVDIESLETADSVNITEPEVSKSPEYEALTVQDYNHFAISSIPIGALSGAIFMIIGFTLHGIVKIFIKV